MSQKSDHTSGLPTPSNVVSSTNTDLSTVVANDSSRCGVRQIIPITLTPKVESPAILPDSHITQSPSETDEENLARELAKRATDLYRKQLRATGRIKQDREELKRTRLNLGKSLHVLKVIYSKPSRTGRWGEVLNGLGIPRATADRYVLAHERLIAPVSAIMPPSELTPEQITVQVKKIAQTLKAVLQTPVSIDRFLVELANELRAT